MKMTIGHWRSAIGMDSGAPHPCTQAFAKVHERGSDNGSLPMGLTELMTARRQA